MDNQDSTREELLEQTAELRHELNSQKELYDKVLCESKLLEDTLTERLKELNCHNQISRLMSNPGITIPELIDQIVMLIPQSWQFSDLAQAIIVVNDQKAQTKGYKKCQCTQSENIVINGETAGYIEVCYPDDCLPDVEDLFLKEEAELLFSIATRIGKYVEKNEKDLKIQQSEIKYRTLIETISEIVYEFNSDGRIEYLSPSVEKILGFRPEELIGKSIFDILHHDDKPLLEERLKSTEQHNSTRHEYRLINKSGEVHWFSKSTSYIQNQGQIFSRIGTLTDITEKKKTEEALIRSNRLFAVISQVNQAIVYIKEKRSFWKRFATSP